MATEDRYSVRWALVAGWGLVRQAGRYLGLAYAASLALALPLAAALASTLEDGMGRSEAGERMRDGFDALWHQSFSARAQGLAKSFDPGVVGIGAVFDGLDGLVTGQLFHAHVAIVGVGLIYLAVWTFLASGLVARFSGRSTRVSFFAEAAHYFPRFAALAALAAVVYALLLGPLLTLLGGAVEEINRETLDERVHFAWVLGKYAIVWAGVWATSVLFDYARVVAVARDCPPIAENLRRAARLVWRHKRRVFGLSGALFGVSVALTLSYWAIAPGAEGGSWPAILWAFAVGQLYLFARIALRGWIYAAQTALGCTLAGEDA